MASGLLCSPIAGKPAPTGLTQPVKAVEYLWEPACRRLGHEAAPAILKPVR
ncbi:hypothetical protein KU43P_04330 [Pseudomonas sp. KU43P]|nr:hypothetical protein KU43P_04330 [Pseudomonas sp. KU43P]